LLRLVWNRRCLRWRRRSAAEACSRDWRRSRPGLSTLRSGYSWVRHCLSYHLSYTPRWTTVCDIICHTLLGGPLCHIICDSVSLSFHMPPVRVGYVNVPPLPAVGHISDVMLVWRQGNTENNCLCTTVLCTIVMVRKGTSSSYMSVDCHFDLASFSSLSSERLLVFVRSLYIYLKNFSLHPSLYLLVS